MCNATSKIMIEKINRNICLIKYRKFPLRDFVKDEEISFYPKIYSHYWLTLEHNSQTQLTKILSSEITKFYKNLSVESLIFFGDYDRKWISKFTKERKDYKPLIQSVDYFKEQKINERFNGAVKVNLSELEEFIKHFFVLTRCDSAFAYYHFLDEKENLLGYIHYSGEIRFDTLTEKMDKMLLEELDKTKFVKKV